jgi:hypothetical protein
LKCWIRIRIQWLRIQHIAWNLKVVKWVVNTNIILKKNETSILIKVVKVLLQPCRYILNNTHIIYLFF